MKRVLVVFVFCCVLVFFLCVAVDLLFGQEVNWSQNVNPVAACALAFWVGYFLRTASK